MLVSLVHPSIYPHSNPMMGCHGPDEGEQGVAGPGEEAGTEDGIEHREGGMGRAKQECGPAHTVSWVLVLMNGEKAGSLGSRRHRRSVSWEEKTSHSQAGQSPQ